jgi:hypothetical protein
MLALVAEEDAVVLSAEANQRRFDTLELLRVALARVCVASKRLQDLDGNWLVDRADIGNGLGSPDNSLHENLVLLARHLLPIGRS